MPVFAQGHKLETFKAKEGSTAAIASSPVAVSAPPVVHRWVQLSAGIVAMMAIANMQYAWTLFTEPLAQGLHTTVAAVQVAFATYVLAGTWLVPFGGYLVDKFGSRLLIAIGGVLVGTGWIGSGATHTTLALIVFYTLGGAGSGVVYGAAIGNALKWFPDHRGLCVGCTAGAYAMGTALTVAPIASMIRTSGYHYTFIFWGSIQGIVVVLAALIIAPPPTGWLPAEWKGANKVQMSATDMTWTQMVRTGSFWIIYLMMTMMAFGGMVILSQIKPIATFYGVDKHIMVWGMSALVLAIGINRITDGFTRPFWGWVSDQFGRENAMFVAFLLEAVAVFGLLQMVRRPLWFILMSSLAFFAWGEIFSLFPAITADLFGRKWSTTNYGIVYTSKGTASIFAGPVAALVSARIRGWVGVFWVMILCDVTAALLALLWLKPVAARTIHRAQADRVRAVGSF